MRFVTAATVPEDYFLYPIDTEVDFLIGNRGGVSVNFARKLVPRCVDGTADEKYADLCRAADWVKTRSLDVEKFPWPQLQAQVIYFGEMHFGQEAKEFMSEHMADLKNQGVGAIGLEMFNSVDQDILDRYLADKATLEEVKTRLIKNWNYESAGYLKVIAGAKAHGLALLALDDRSLGSVGDFFKTLQLRDFHMAKIIADAIAARPSLKMAVLCGRMHAFGEFSKEKLVLSQPAILRDQHAITTQSVLVFSEVEVGAVGFNIMQKAILGERVSSVLIPPEGYGYGDFFLFLKSPAGPKGIPKGLNDQPPVWFLD
jgi:hypothetical protein